MRRRRVALLAAALLLAACSSTPRYRNADLAGTISYPQPVTFGPGAVLMVYLVDASGPESPLGVDLQKLDNPAPGQELFALSTVEGVIRSGTGFSLPVPLDKIDQGHDYALKALIREAVALNTA